MWPAQQKPVIDTQAELHFIAPACIAILNNHACSLTHVNWSAFQGAFSWMVKWCQWQALNWRWSCHYQYNYGSCSGILANCVTCKCHNHSNLTMSIILFLLFSCCHHPPHPNHSHPPSYLHWGDNLGTTLQGCSNLINFSCGKAWVYINMFKHVVNLNNSVLC